MVVAAAVGGSRLSRSMDRVRQRTREVEQLEGLSRDLLAAPPDGSALSDLLRQHIPGMLSFSRVAIRLYDDDAPLLIRPETWEGVPRSRLGVDGSSPQSTHPAQRDAPAMGAVIR